MAGSFESTTSENGAAGHSIGARVEQRLDAAEIAYMALTELADHDNIVEQASIASRRASIAALRGDWSGAIANWRKQATRLLSITDVSKRGSE